ncbi:MAG: LytR/AlgR family response regulator transcription factor [Cytophagales bacterium]
MEGIILKCLAVDDEPYALKLISEDISGIPFLNLMGVCPSAKEAKSFLERNPVDLIFLDIQMPEITGLQFLKQHENLPMVILTTAYNQYAIEGFELEVIDYLMKPIPRERFKKAAQRAKEQFLLRNKKGEQKRYIFVHSEYKEIKIDIDAIDYVEGLKDYVKIFLHDQNKPVLTRLNLKAMEARLPNGFCRIHNSFLVPLSKITSFQKSQVYIGNQALPVGDKYAEGFLERYRK